MKNQLQLTVKYNTDGTYDVVVSRELDELEFSGIDATVLQQIVDEIVIGFRVAEGRK